MIAELSLIKIAAAIILSGIVGLFALLFIEIIFNSIIKVRTQKDPSENRGAIEELIRNLECGMDLKDCRVDTYDLEWLLAESRMCGWWKVIAFILVTGLVFELIFKSYL